MTPNEIATKSVNFFVADKLYYLYNYETSIIDFFAINIHYLISLYLTSTFLQLKNNLSWILLYEELINRFCQLFPSNYLSEYVRL